MSTKIGGSAAVVLLLMACGGTPEEKPASDDDPAPTLSSLRSSIFDSKCTTACHSGGNSAAGMLDMSHDLHAALVGVAATSSPCRSKQQKRVVAGDPNASLLYLKVMAKIHDAEAPCGESMPESVSFPALSTDEAELIRRWIAAGALND
jgi:hypothetical protein